MDSFEATLEPGQRLLDRYAVIGRIDTGGHSLVYRAQDERLHRPVCIKVFHWLEKHSPIYRTTYQHFIQEAQALSRLQHPNTLRIYDFGYLPDGGPPFQVSEYMDSGSVFHRVRSSGPLPREEVITIARDIGGALDEAHEAGIVHRDIKPKNILLTRAGSRLVTKLADFGIAKAHTWGEDTAIVAGAPMLLYSPLWAAPEQLAGGELTGAADIYAMALVTSFLLTGKFVFRERSPDKAREERSVARERLTEVFRGSPVPAAMHDVLRRALHTSPDARPGRASELAEELARGGDAEGEVARFAAPPSTRSRPLRLDPAQDAQTVAGRPVRFESSTATPVKIHCGRAEVGVAVVPSGPHGFAVQVTGRNCFVARAGARPSNALTLADQTEIDLVAPSMAPLGRLTVHFGRIAAGHRLFEIGEHTLAIAADDWPSAVAIDAGEAGIVIVGRT